MARPRKPTDLHKLTGTYRRDRHAGRGDVHLKPNGEPVMPDWLDAKGREAWRELVAAQAEAVLWRSDSIFLALMADLLVQIRAGEASSGAQALFFSGLSKMGATPASRAKLSIPERPAPNPFEGF